MSKITCKKESRTHVPYGWLAIEFCNLKFYGDPKEIDKLKTEWHNIEFEKYHKMEKEDDKIKEEIKKIENEISVLESKISELLFKTYPKKSFLQWLFNIKTEEEKLDQVEKFQCGRSIAEKNILIIEKNELIENNQKNRFYSAITLSIKADDFLAEKGFVLTNSFSRGSECVTTTEMFERNI